MSREIRRGRQIGASVRRREGSERAKGNSPVTMAGESAARQSGGNRVYLEGDWGRKARGDGEEETLNLLRIYFVYTRSVKGLGQESMG